MHVQVNVTDLETFAYRPYNSLGEYCEPDDVVGCLLNSNIIITTSIFVVLWVDFDIHNHISNKETLKKNVLFKDEVFGFDSVSWSLLPCLV